MGVTAALQPPFLSFPALWSRLSQTCRPPPPTHYKGDSTAAVMRLWWLHLNWLTRFCSFSPSQPPFSALPGHVKAIEILSLGPVFRAIGAFFCHPEWIRGFKTSLSVQIASKTRLMWASKLHEAPNELFRGKRVDWLWRVCVITVPVHYLFILILPYITGILNPLYDLHRVTTI